MEDINKLWANFEIDLCSFKNKSYVIGFYEGIVFNKLITEKINYEQYKDFKLKLFDKLVKNGLEHIKD